MLGAVAKPIKLGSVTKVINKTILPASPSGGSGGLTTDTPNRGYTATENSYYSTYHRFTAHLNYTQPIGLFVHLHGDGAWEYTNYNDAWSLGGANGIIAKAKAKNMLVIVPLSPDDTNKTWWHWSDPGENDVWLDSLIRANMSAYNIDKNRIWFSTFSGGSQFLTKYYLPRYANTINGGGAVIFGGGNKIDTTLTPFNENFKNMFKMHWNTGMLDDGTEPGSDGFNGLAAARAGEQWYREQGIVTKLFTPEGQGHEWTNTFGARVGDVLNAYL